MEMLFRVLIFVPLFAQTRATVFAALHSGGKGAVIGTDGLDAQGPLVGNRHAEKVFRINPLSLVCVASYNADAHGLYKELRRVCSMHQASCDEVLGASSVAHMARQLVHERFPRAHVLVVGGERELSAPYTINEILPGGTRVEQDVAVAGSGSSMVVSLLNELWPTDQVTQDGAAAAAKKLRRAVQAAIRSDSGSGGHVSLWSVSSSVQGREISSVVLSKMED
jgi:20S proteasome alpha/beta subunit